MKIFNWVHSRFHHKDGFGRYVKREECHENESETQALLKNVALADVINGWSEGVLTIGTFGFDPLKNFDLKAENEEDHDDECCFDDKDNKIESHCDDEVGEQGDLIVTVDGNVICPYNKMKKGERITLADLFYADSDANEIAKTEDGKVRPDPLKKKPAPDLKDGVSIVKKVIPKGEDSHPIRKINRLMKRMKKRKIHPDLEGKLLKKEGSTTTTTPTVSACFKTHGGVDESTSQDNIMVCA